MKYQSSSTHCSKDISKVKVSERRTEQQNDSQDKNNMAPLIFDLGGIKRVEVNIFESGNSIITEISRLFKKTPVVL